MHHIEMKLNDTRHQNCGKKQIYITPNAARKTASEMNKKLKYTTAI